jgi:hypothetical protein
MNQSGEKNRSFLDSGASFFGGANVLFCYSRLELTDVPTGQVTMAKTTKILLPGEY